MVQSTIKTRVAIINYDGMCRCSNCMASLGMSLMNLELLVVVTRDRTQLPTLLKKAALVVEAHESTKITAMRIVRAINDLVLSEDPDSDDLIHPDDLIPHLQRLYAQQVTHN